MTDPKVPEPTGYRAAAAELRRIADALDTLPPDLPQPNLMVTLVLENDRSIEVDMVGEAVIGRRGTTDPNGIYHASDYRPNRGNFTVQSSVTDPRDAELERLRARVAELRGEAEATR